MLHTLVNMNRQQEHQVLKGNMTELCRSLRQEDNA